MECQSRLQSDPDDESVEMLEARPYHSKVFKYAHTGNARDDKGLQPRSRRARGAYAYARPQSSAFLAVSIADQAKQGEELNTSADSIMIGHHLRVFIENHGSALMPDGRRLGIRRVEITSLNLITLSRSARTWVSKSGQS